MSESRPIDNIVSEIQQLIQDLDTYGDQYSLAVELAHQMLEEIEEASDE